MKNNKIFIATLIILFSGIISLRAVPVGYVATGNQKGGECTMWNFWFINGFTCTGQNGVCAAEFTNGTYTMWELYPVNMAPVDTDPLNDGSISHEEAGVDEEGNPTITYYYNP